MFVSKRSLVTCVLSSLLCHAAWAQIDPCTQSLPPPPIPGRPRVPDPDAREKDEMRRSQEKKMNQERQFSLKKDSEELLRLANELKQSVDKTTERTLSVEVIRKTQQIEKLAKNVREKMKGNQYCDLQAP